MIGIPQRVLSARGAAEDLAWARAEAERLSQPVALLIPPGVVATVAHEGPAPRPAAPRRQAAAETTAPIPRISRYEALAAALGVLGREPVVHANGYICRESFAVKDRPESFYMLGSMGLASAIGLGIALARPDLPTVIFDGDGNLLMALGILPMIGGGPLMGRGRPRTLIHVVFDNGVYGSTGNQISPSRQARLDGLALAAGYERVVAVDTVEAIQAALAGALDADGPHFILAAVTADEHPAPRIPYAPEEIRDRFRRTLGGSA
jgi:hypothetical protein